jgi:hypothetical protein
LHCTTTRAAVQIEASIILRMGDTTNSAAAQNFITRWSGVTASELSTAQSFVRELCDLLGVDAPHPTPEQNYMFERPITFTHGDGSTSAGRIDCYRQGHFVLEAKKLKSATHTQRFDAALLRARAQAEGYARALPSAEGRPPFLLVVDVGNVIELYSEFTRSGATYTPFPDPRSHRIKLDDLANPSVLHTLRSIWTQPDSLDPSRASARVTREVAARLAELAKSMEKTGHRADHVGAFLTRCLFSMFAEDVELLPKGSFLHLLQTHCDQPATLQQMLRTLWADMDHGGFSAALAAPVLHFNGKLFKAPLSDGYSLLLNKEQIGLLISAAKANWREVEPAIFGTLLERALDPTERHALGAHYTPRAYVERLVLPTVVEPLRADWANAQAASLVLAQEAAELSGKAFEAKMAEARAEVQKFHHQLCTTRVLDPACGSGNFLYVTLEHLKRLEGEVLNQLEAFGQTQDSLALEGETVTLQQLRGIELNERAAALAELVLWIGFLQWHIRTRGNKAVAEPVVHNYGNIECRDAVLAWDDLEPAYDADGVLLTRWDGKTFKVHPVTGARVPDEAAQVPQWKYLKARKAQWPQADFVVGNPPFIGNKRMREALGDGYTQALRAAWPEIPESADFVMYWWAHAAALVNMGALQRMGLITTNSLTMIFNRRIVEAALNGQTLAGLGGSGARHAAVLILPNAQKSGGDTPHSTASAASLVFAIPDHPWVDSANGAAVRIAMTVLAAGAQEGDLLVSRNETPGEHGEVNVTFGIRHGTVHADLTAGANVTAAQALLSNSKIANRGVIPHGAGFLLTPDEARALGWGSIAELDAHIRDYRNGKDLADQPRGVKVIDLYGLNAEEVRDKFPALYQWMLERVKPERDLNNRPRVRELWWLFAEARSVMRAALFGLPRYAATGQVAKHRTFQFLDSSILPDDKLIAIALPDAFHLGVLSSGVHTDWALALGGRLGVGNDPVYSKSTCFDTFPFPDQDTSLTPALRSRIATLAEQIDAHRKKVLGQAEADVKLTLTGLYNVLEALKAGRELTAKEKQIHTQGLVGVLKDLHDELGTAVLQAYGWADLGGAAQDTPELLTRLVALNARRAEEEKAGTVRWLRPEFQNPENPQTLSNRELLAHIPQAQQASLPLDTEQPTAPKTDNNAQPWPATLPEQVRAVAAVLGSSPSAMPLSVVEASFKGRGPWKKSLPRILETLEALGRAKRESDVWRGQP